MTLGDWCTFNFVEPIFDVSSLRRLDEEDVYALSPFFKHKNLFRKYLRYKLELVQGYNRLFSVYQHILPSHPTNSLVWFLIASNSLDLILDVVLELWSAVVGENTYSDFSPSEISKCSSRIRTSFRAPADIGFFGKQNARKHSERLLLLVAHVSCALVFCSS